jgi:hypothetical protein
MSLSRRLVIWPHHPDALQLPAADRWDPTPAEAMTWNIFRTLELMPPAFWLRRLNAFLGLVPPRPASVTATVRLWAPLPMPPRFGVSVSDGVRTDVLIETEHAVWALIVCADGDSGTAGSDADIDPVAMLAYAASWFAGRRDCYVGAIIGSRPNATQVTVALIEKYQLSPNALKLRIPRGHDPSNVIGFGFTSWHCLIAVVRDLARGDVIHSVERVIAQRTLNWCEEAVCPI